MMTLWTNICHKNSKMKIQYQNGSRRTDGMVCVLYTGRYENRSSQSVGDSQHNSIGNFLQVLQDVALCKEETEEANLLLKKRPKWQRLTWDGNIISA